MISNPGVPASGLSSIARPIGAIGQEFIALVHALGPENGKQGDRSVTGGQDEMVLLGAVRPATEDGPVQTGEQVS